MNEVDELRNALVAFTALKEANERGILNDVADDLRVTYNQLKNSKDTKMTIILGEIYRVMLKRVFKILGKHGISLE